MANVIQKYKRYVAVGCSHGSFADEAVCRSALKFIRDYAPEERLHLGDFLDTTAFRAGAAGTKDQSVDLTTDLTSGLSFLRELRPTILLNGNHEDRIFRDMHHPDAIRARAACTMIEEIRRLTKQMKCRYVEHYDITRSWVELGGVKFLHGFMYSENALRDHAEHFGDCVIAHLHKPGVAAGRRSTSSIAYCVGLLANIQLMSYAKTRRATSQWGHAVVYGEYSSRICTRNLQLLVR